MSLISNDDYCSQRPGRRHGRPLVVGLVNNMPDKALASTERQFRELLGAASDGCPIVLRFFSLPGVPRSDTARQHVGERHESIDNLWGAELDGLIVTGTEPRAARLADEPYWPALLRLVDWAADRTVSTIWSCLAAHAAVHCLDGIERQTFPAKVSGIFECAKTSEHPLLNHRPDRWATPHSRHNGLPENALEARGYRILGRSAVAGADLFVKSCGSLFVFLQGHPEYDAGALLREYRRDVARFLAGTDARYPELPQGYFDAPAGAALLRFRERALRRRDPALLAEFPSGFAAEALRDPWRPAAIRLYANWLAYLASQRRREAGHIAADAAVPAYG